MGGTLESWDLVAPLLAGKRRVLRYDTRGAGLSQKVRGALTIDTMVDDLVALLDALGIAGKVALAGIAVGGAIALHAAFRFPERIAAVDRQQPATGIAPDRRAAALARVERRWSARACARSSIRSTNGYPPELRDRRGALRGLPRPLARQRSGELCRHLPHARRHGPAAGAARIACPVLVIAGALDRMRPPRWSSRWLRRYPARVQGAGDGALRGLQTPELLREIASFSMRSGRDPRCHPGRAPKAREP